jgi:polar amino acid transport system substrate-binding protein
MKKEERMNKRVIFIVGIYVCLFATWVQAETLHIVCEEEWRPYVFEQDGVAKGFSPEVLEHVFDKMGVSIKITPYPWNRALKMVFSGETDALFEASKKPDREEACYYPSEPLFYSNYVFFILKEHAGKLKYESFDDLKGYTVGVCDGYSYTSEFWEFLKAQNNFVSTVNDESLLKMLNLGRVDIVPVEIGNAIELLKKLGIQDRVVHLPKPLTQKPYYIIFNKQRVEEAFVEEFSHTLRDFKQTSEYDALFEKYLQ